MEKPKFILKPIVLIIISNMILISIVTGQNPKNNPTYELVFVDEFDSIAVDISKWHYSWPWNQTGFIDTYWCKNIPNGIDYNLYGYRKRNFDNCIIDTTGTGSLTIVSKKENYWGKVWNWPFCSDDSCNTGDGYFPCDYTTTPPTCWDVDSLQFNYTTNLLLSKEKFKYGYFEMRCKFSKPTPPMTNKGIGPNFWLYSGGSIVKWSELDIFEFDGETNIFGSNMHYKDIYEDSIHGINSPKQYVDFSNFHTFAMDWTPNKIDFYLDDILYHTTDTFHIADLNAMNIIIDVNFPIHTMCQLVDTVNTQLPHYYEIDYVKVYQIKSDCETDYHICNYNNIDYKHYKSITIGGNSCNVIVPAHEKLNLIYSKNLDIFSNFSLQNGAEFFTRRIPCFESIHFYPSKSEETPQPAPESFIKRQNPIYHEN